MVYIRTGSGRYLNVVDSAPERDNQVNNVFCLKTMIKDMGRYLCWGKLSELRDVFGG